MTRVFVYEHLTAVGLGRTPSDPAHSLFREGKAMRDAVADDFRRVPGVAVVGLDAGSGGSTYDRFRAAARGADYTLVIAPETSGTLQSFGVVAERDGLRLLGCTPGAVNGTADKLALASVWRRAGVRTPEVDLACDWRSDRVPAVIKPRDGAGSFATYFCPDPGSFVRHRETAYNESPSDPIAQDFVPGRAASVSFLIGSNQTVPLAPAFQHLSDDGRFRYLGGELPIPPALADRAVRLGRQAVACVDGLLGYVGVDLVLGDAADGSEDYAIEINPRLTTSYVGLRALADFNLAEVMLKLVNSEPVAEPRWKPGRAGFTPDGVVESGWGAAFSDGNPKN